MGKTRDGVSLVIAFFFLLTVRSSPVPTNAAIANLRMRENSCVALGNRPVASGSTQTTTIALPIDTLLPPLSSKPPSSRSATSSPSSTPSTQALTRLDNILKTGYVAFGDSYAAGMGTGITSTDSCRLGSTSYPGQLSTHRPPGGRNFDFQNLPCSGARVNSVLQGGPNSQIDKWQNPGTADIATISIGGNDVGFSDILDACVLRVEGVFAGNCDDFVAKAYTIMAARALHTDISSALHQIVEKSGRTDQNENIVALQKVLRTQLNKLVFDVNTFLHEITTEVNSFYNDANKVTFVDPNPYFDTHRFCEKGANGNDVQEPDSGRTGTYLFLSGWIDNELPNDLQPVNPRPPLDADGTPTTVALPDPNTCDNSSSTNTDVSDLFLCDISKAISVAGSQEAMIYQNMMNNVTRNEISGWLPTRQAKTFHPKTLGHLQYVRAINAAI